MPHEGFTAEHRMIGRIACWGALIIGLLYTVFAALSLLNNPPTAQAAFGDPFRPIASILLVPTAALMIASMAAVHAYAPPELRIYSLLSLVFMSCAMGTTTIFNFGFYSVFTHPVEMANAPWLSLFVPTKKPGLIGSLDHVAWGWFFGLSMIAAAPVFREGMLENTLRMVMLATGMLCVVGWTIMISLPSARIPALIMQALGWGVLVIVVWFLLARVFDRAHPIVRRSA